MSRSPRVAEPNPALLDTPRAPLFDLEIAVVTPLFGGSATPGVVDARHPVHAASVRGHLRFWWRACKATGFDTPDALFAAESAVWGNTELPSRLTVAVRTVDPGRKEACATRQLDNQGRERSVPTWTFGYPGYALFPFQGEARRGNNAGKLPAEAREGVVFRLSIGTVPGVAPREAETLRAHAEAALWAWLAFGGMGARTRRGCGSLYCSTAPFAPPSQATAAQLAAWVGQSSARYVTPGPRRLPLPVLHGARLLLGTTPAEPKRAWGDAVATMQRFRQGEGVGRNPGGSGRPGRSRWPEADSIRRLAGTHAGAHPPEHPAGSYYPRADLGLPIIVHFKDEREGDPPQATIQTAAGSGDGGQKATRMASPIVLKPLAVSGSQAVALALCLDAPHLWDREIAAALTVQVGVNRRTHPLASTDLHESWRAETVHPLREARAADARTAFLRMARAQLKAGEEVTL